MKNSKPDTLEFDPKMFSPEGFQTLLSMSLSFLDEEESTNILFITRVYSILQSPKTESTNRFYALYLLFKLTDEKNPILAYHIANNSHLMEFIQITAQCESTARRALDERGAKYFSRNPSETEAILGINFVRLALECLILWKRKYGDSKKKPWRAFEIEDQILKNKVEHFTWRYYHFIDKDYDLSQDLATWNYLENLPNIKPNHHLQERKNDESRAGDLSSDEYMDYDHMVDENEFLGAASLRPKQELYQSDFISVSPFQVTLSKNSSEEQIPHEEKEETENYLPILVNLEREPSEQKNDLCSNDRTRSDEISESSSSNHQDSPFPSKTQETLSKSKKANSNVLVWESQSLALKGKSSSQRTPFVNHNDPNSLLRSDSLTNSPSSQQGQNTLSFTNTPTSKQSSKVYHAKMLNEVQQIERSIMKSRTLTPGFCNSSSQQSTTSNTPNLRTLKTSAFEKESNKINGSKQVVETREARVVRFLEEFSPKPGNTPLK